MPAQNRPRADPGLHKPRAIRCDLRVMRLRLLLPIALVALLPLAACRTPQAPKPSRSAKVGPKPVSAKPDPLRSWTDKTPAKLALVSFVEKSAAGDSGAFIPPSERLAVVSHSAAAVLPQNVTREFVAYLRANDYRVLLVTDAQPEARAALGDALGLPRDQVVGPYPQSAYKLIDGVPSVVPLSSAASTPAPVLVHQFAGRRPVLALAGSDADADLLDYATLRNPRPALGLVVRKTASGSLAASAPARGWLTITEADWTK